MIRATIGILAGTGRKPVALAATGVGENSFTANWEAFEGAVYYLLDVSTQEDFSTFVYENEVINAPTTSYVVIGLEDDTTYYYRLRASTEPLGLLEEWQYPDAAAAYSLRKLRHDYKGAAVEVRRSSDNTTKDIGFIDGELDTASLEDFVAIDGEDVAPADHGSGAAAAYSLRYVSASYTGDVIQVRRSSDSAIQDFNPTEITDGTLANFCGAGVDGFVTIWYDQSGNSNDATQSTASNQPQIVLSGSVITENGKPAIDFDGSNDYLSNASSLSYNGGVSWYSVYNLIGGTNKRLWCDDITGVQGYVTFYYDDRYQVNNNATGYNAITPSGFLAQQQLASFNFDDSNGNFNYAFDGSNTSGSIVGWTGPIDTNESANLGIMSAGNGAQYGEGKMQELVIYPNNQSSNRTGIEANINKYYSIHTNTQNAFVTTWYDQSGNGRNATQSTDANQPQIVSSGSVILENGEPSLSFDGTDDYLLTGSVLDVNGLSNLYFFTVVQTDNTAYAGNSNKAIFWMAETGSWGQIHNSLTQTQVAFRFGTGQSGNEQSTTITSSTSMRLLSLYKNNTVDRVDVNGDNKINYTSALGTIANTSNVFNIGRGLVQYMPMNLSELIFYASDQSSNRTGIQTNINANYNIYWDGSQTSLLDTYGGSAAAYSLRALSSSYTGALIEVRRASDNATQDIYAKYDGSLNVDALESFCSGTNGFVTTWYDQSGNGNDATQTTAASQPQIVSSGSVIKENGKPSIRFDFDNKTLLEAGDFSSLTEAELFLLVKSYMVGSSRNEFIDFGSSGSSNHYPFNNVIYDDFGSTVRKTTGTPVQPVTQLNIYGVTTKPNLWESRINSIQQFQTTSNTVGFKTNAHIGQDITEYFFRGWISELIIYPSDQSSNRTGIETNINSHYNIY